MNLLEQIGHIRLTTHRTLARRMAQTTDLSWMQLRVLRAVVHFHVRTQAEVAESLFADPAVICRTVDKLEAGGLLVRREGDDRRSVRLEATPAATRYVERMLKEFDQLEEEVCGPLSAGEVATLRLLLQKVEVGMAAASDEGAEDAARARDRAASRSRSARTARQAKGAAGVPAKRRAGRRP